MATPIGLLPTPSGLDTAGLDVSHEDMAELLRVDVEGWRREVPLIEKHYAKFGAALPAQLRGELEALRQRLDDAS